MSTKYTKEAQHILKFYTISMVLIFIALLFDVSFTSYLIYKLIGQMQPIKVILNSDNSYLFIYPSMVFMFSGLLIILHYIRHREPSTKLYYYQRDGQRRTLIASVLITIFLHE